MFDDIQWGEELFLDLIEHVALLFLGRADPAVLHRATGARGDQAGVALDAPP